MKLLDRFLNRTLVYTGHDRADAYRFMDQDTWPFWGKLHVWVRGKRVYVRAVHSDGAPDD